MTYCIADDRLKLKHWLRHYIGRLGVWANHTRIVLRMRLSASEAEVNATVAVAIAAGVPASNILRQHSPPSDAIKIALMNAHITSIADHEWHIYAGKFLACIELMPPPA